MTRNQKTVDRIDEELRLKRLMIIFVKRGHIGTFKTVQQLWV